MSILSDLLSRYPQLSPLGGDIDTAAAMLIAAYRQGGTVFIAGNGGSAADASHIVGEFMKGFVRKRPLPATERQALAAVPDGAWLAERLQCGLPAISLMSQEGITTAVQNDLGGELGPAQQLYAMGRPGDVLIGISTSGNARNVHLACQVARVRGLRIIGLTGAGGGRLAGIADLCLRVPETETYKVQELHLPVYHALCMMVEEAFFPL